MIVEAPGTNKTTGSPGEIIHYYSQLSGPFESAVSFLLWEKCGQCEPNKNVFLKVGGKDVSTVPLNAAALPAPSDYQLHQKAVWLFSTLFVKSCKDHCFYYSSLRSLENKSIFDETYSTLTAKHSPVPRCRRQCILCERWRSHGFVSECKTPLYHCRPGTYWILFTNLK